MTPHDAARPVEWQFRFNDHNPWTTCSERQAEERRSNGFQTRALYTAADYDALRAELSEERGRHIESKEYFQGVLGQERTRTEAAEAKALEVSVAARRARAMIDHYIHGEDVDMLESAFDALTDALNEGGE